LAVTPEANSRLAVVLSDEGRVGAAKQVGPQVARIEGRLVATADTGYVVAVSDVQGLFGARSRWAGETVSLRREHVAVMYERRFSRPRTIAALVGAAGALVALATATDIFGMGGSGVPVLPPGGEPPGQ
jgi:hypothetical protein